MVFVVYYRMADFVKCERTLARAHMAARRAYVEKFLEVFGEGIRSLSKDPDSGGPRFRLSVRPTRTLRLYAIVVSVYV